jgi:hypothetical protein
MADFISAITPNANLTVADTATWSDGTSKDTGDLRRKFNFGTQVSELAIAQDPFFRFVSKVAKKSTDDPSFKFTEERGSWHKRYAYPVGWGASKGAIAVNQATVTPGLINAKDAVIYVQMETDYKSSGNIQNTAGNSSQTTLIGASGTTPAFYLEGQMVKINTHANIAAATTALAFVAKDYFVGKVEEVDTDTLSAQFAVVLKLRIVRAVTADANNELSGFGSTGTGDQHVGQLSAAQLSALRIHDQLEKARSYVVGTAHAEGSGYPETWFDQPYSTGFGLTQIFKTSCAMTNTARATVLKYEPNEWARVWKNKLIEHKYDIEQALLFGSQGTTQNIQYTQGAVDFVSTYGSTFSLATATKTADDFLDDLSGYMDPRYNNSKATVFFCSTAVYNWLHKLGGYFSNNLNINSNFSADLAVTGRKKVLGLDTTTISTVYGDMNVVRNVHLDGTNVQMLGLNMKQCKYRPLVGNGVNRDTSVYVGVQTLENSGVDRRVDLILTEAGMEWSMPETHAIWTA